MKKPIVYAVCEPTHVIGGVERKAMNILPAAEHGEIVVLMPQSQSLLAPVPTVRALREKLKDFSDDDFILPVGDPALMSTVAIVASEINHGRIKFLKWDRELRKYHVIQIDTSGKAI